MAFLALAFYSLGIVLAVWEMVGKQRNNNLIQMKTYKTKLAIWPAVIVLVILAICSLASHRANHGQAGDSTNSFYSEFSAFQGSGHSVSP